MFEHDSLHFHCWFLSLHNGIYNKPILIYIIKRLLSVVFIVAWQQNQKSSERKLVYSCIALLSSNGLATSINMRAMELNIILFTHTTPQVTVSLGLFCFLIQSINRQHGKFIFIVFNYIFYWCIFFIFNNFIMRNKYCLI